jgi:hypothetical protein
MLDLAPFGDGLEDATGDALELHLFWSKRHGYSFRKKGKNDPVYEENWIKNHTNLSTSDMWITPKI